MIKVIKIKKKKNPPGHFLIFKLTNQSTNQLKLTFSLIIPKPRVQNPSKPKTTLEHPCRRTEGPETHPRPNRSPRPTGPQTGHRKNRQPPLPLSTPRRNATTAPTPRALGGGGVPRPAVHLGTGWFVPFAMVCVNA